MKALALCHNVTPVMEEVEDERNGNNGGSEEEAEEDVVIFSKAAASKSRISYQASSPDEVP